MNKIRIAIVGYGNIGSCCVDSVLTSPDIELAGIVRRNISLNETKLNGITITDDIAALGKIDVAILAVPTANVREHALKYLSMGINTVDSYDIHGSIFDLRQELDEAAKKNNSVSIISAGWDPGSDSVIRALLMACAPRGITYTNFGPGMSMGHTVAAKAINGVSGALSVTIPLGTGLHRRMVYVQPEDGADMKVIAQSIKSDPYFSHDETHIIETSNINELLDTGHGVNLTRKGVSGTTPNQIFEFNMKINNPALTAQIMVSSARASMKRLPGAYTLIEIPVIDFLYGDQEQLIRQIV